MYVNLRYELMVKGVSQKLLAQKIGMGSTTISEKMNGKQDFKLKECLEIKKILKTDLTVDELFAWKDVENEILS
ncbi:helix-turn-helix transcriptional regulator [uncultured Dubosiella sp.]|uniref:helix-turn-helix domain-containing protein n=2 Tax=uncultured Dubosiella sp. TaxID=1937011 RepID=UPI002626F9E6|nr:helix-turn-helix transcriptional regulator [uncultured Dubosiella sp.]